ncbi:MAG: DNA translocase FtsK 4TM domain-containing protein [Gammaproteobacteria bacterium]|nr:DNA translocase FtsK 4TM domain-containing protein [Gammaproteobacteria bacterium]MDH5239153.1 DNA translocase FtsK 4TM domain-containing protein [Gammaproteobacteria bacterium]MDH5260324.1 DNA translocase FtsK 4TM domain-containing protein [Gammaproteobacteria bacterium]MDH5582613.1 DNA translocase FtsK 4TM domain-containing protein [Gammaproteobacteria bacterium]
MAIATKTKQAESKLSSQVHRALREGALYVFGALALILWYALVTYDQGDPGPSQTTTSDTVSNGVGWVGAWVADLLFSGFGRPAYLFAVMVFFLGWMLYREQRTQIELTRLDFGLRFGGFVATLATSCALATLHFSSEGFNNTAGGIVGQALGTWLQDVMKLLGASVLLFCLWIASVSLFLGISWIRIMDRIGHWSLVGFEKARFKIGELRDKAEGRRSAAARQDIVKVEKRLKANRVKPRIEPVLAPLAPSERAEKERQVPLFDPPAAGELPPLSLLDDPPEQKLGYSEDSLEAMSRLVELKLKDFGIDVEVKSVSPGPVITRFELDPAPGVKVSQISNLAKDLARSLSVVSVRIVEVIPGKSFVGLEIPNENRQLVTLGEILKSRAYENLASPITLALGKDIGGSTVVVDLARMPHLLIAGTTGSGKSVGINAMVLSILYKTQPEHVRLIMIDPKMLELSVYEGIPHLLAPVVTDMKDAANSLRWCVAEMDRRYQVMSALGVRNIGGYNRKVRDAIEAGKPIKDPTFRPPDLFDEDKPIEHPTLQPMPFIVVIIDELADMMMIVGKKVEELIARLAQKARASGIHLILATQRPSVDVITGLIKANVPTRIAFQVSAKVDSRTILDQMGAENLLGHGDMLYLPPGTSVPVRVHGAFVSDEEVHKVVRYLKQSGPPRYIDEILDGPSSPTPGLTGIDKPGDYEDPEQDALYDQAVQVVLETRKASISGVQRRLKIGYNRAARMVEAMEAAGMVGPLQSNGMREILVKTPADDE